MPTLAQQLGETAPVSSLVRKARRLGIAGLESAIEVAAIRGCKHYRSATPLAIPDPGLDRLSDDELTILLILGENVYHPTAIRCAAQLARSPRIDPHRLAALAIQHKAVRVLTHISRAGLAHDTDGKNFWITVISNLPSAQARSEPDLPHWSRFVSMPGIQKSGPAVTRWLTPIP